LFTKTAVDPSHPLQKFTFKRLEGSEDLYTIRTQEHGGRYVSVFGECTDQLTLRDNVYGWAEVWRLKKQEDESFIIANEWRRNKTTCINKVFSVESFNA